MNKQIAAELHSMVMETVKDQRKLLNVKPTSRRIKDDDRLAFRAIQLIEETSEALQQFLERDGTQADALLYIAALFSNQQLIDLMYRRLPGFRVADDPLEDDGLCLPQ